MQRVLLAAAVATAVLGAASASAATRHKHRAARVPHVAAQTYPVPVQRGPRVGPTWSGPNQCWTDEGYGRYAPCDGGGKAF